ncbi:hypothetical protein HN709_02590 [Candidatus Peregrinibacteria bacterium]|nr:hypothetical protein [Candidatus Peregrinibacteria bacterium]MBT7736551.1 hypothetical protein [Candidatus Peregrinibacteria bacterium]
MKSNLLDQLCQIGFTDSESQVYLELLSLGPQAVSVIAKRTSLNRTTTYSILKSLEVKGVVSSYTNATMKYFVANDPNSLVGYVDRKCKTFDYHRNNLLNLVPKFRCLSESFSLNKPVITYFEGIEGVKNVMFDALSAKDTFRAYVCLDKWLKSGHGDFLIEFKDLRIFDKKIPLKTIVPDTPEVREFFKEHYDMQCELTDILYVPASGMFENEMNIYNDKVSIIHLEKGSEYGVVIQDSQIAEMHRSMFDIMWQKFKNEYGKKKIG